MSNDEAPASLAVDPYTTGLTAGNAYWMARLSMAVYEKVSESNQLPDRDRILADLRAEDDGFVDVVGADRNSAQAAFVEHANYYCIAFRGTNELADWLDNINAFAVDELFGSFHRGFWNSVQDVWQPVYSLYQERNAAARRPLFLTGHSLGGAMATIAAARLVHLDLPFTSVYTFGQPRAMSRNASRVFNAECRSRFFRFHNNNDIVTRVPARLMGYSHVGSYLYIAEEGTIHREPGFWFRFLDVFDGAVSALRERGIDGIEDHNMAKYLAAIKRWDVS